MVFYLRDSKNKTILEIEVYSSSNNDLIKANLYISEKIFGTDDVKKIENHVSDLIGMTDFDSAYEKTEIMLKSLAEKYKLEYIID